MHRERQAILSLIALGKITPREAERLLAAWNAGREEFWVIGVCVAACVSQFLPELAAWPNRGCRCIMLWRPLLTG